MAADSVPKTAIVTPFGLWECLLDYKNAAQAFQRFINGIFRQLDFAFVYLDDILIASSSDNEHFDHLRQVFDLLSANGLVINISKCVFGVTELDYLGHKVTIKGIQPLPDRIKSIQNLPIPTDHPSHDETPSMTTAHPTRCRRQRRFPRHLNTDYVCAMT